MTNSSLSVLAWVDTRGGPLAYVEQELTAMAAVPTVDLHIERERSWSDLGPALLSHRPDVFHFIGHGGHIGLETWDGSTGGTRERSSEEIRNRLSAAPTGGPRGLFFNACHSARSAPTLIPPAGGWVVGTNTKIDDDVAGMFAPAFYRHLVVTGTTAETAHRMAMAEMIDEGFDSRELQHSVWVKTSLLPDPRDTARDINKLLWTIFNRSAFRDPAVRELSFQDLDQALEDVLTALGTGQIFTRHARARPFAVIDVRLLDDPQVKKLVQRAGRAVQDARLSLRQLQNTFPNVLNMTMGFGQVTDSQKRDQLIALLDVVDKKRNAVLRVVNTYMRLHGQQTLRPIELSSKSLPGPLDI